MISIRANSAPTPCLFPQFGREAAIVLVEVLARAGSGADHHVSASEEQYRMQGDFRGWEMWEIRNYVYINDI